MSLEKLAQAIENRDVEQVKALVKSRSVKINARLPRTDGPPAVLFAHGSLEILKLLLNAGADVNGSNRAAETTCHVAAWRGDVELLKLLLEHHVNVDAVDGHDQTPLQISVLEREKPSMRFIAMLVEAGASVDVNDDRVLCAVAAASTQCTRMMIDRGIVLSKLRDYDERTPLFWADAAVDDGATMRMLVDVCGVALDARDASGNTCCHALATKNSSSLRWAIAAGADLEVTNHSGFTPLLKLCQNMSPQDEESLFVLLAGGANVHAQALRGRTALHLIAFIPNDARTGSMTVMKAVHALLAAGADFDAVSQSGGTPRLLLAERGIVDPNNVELARRRIAKTRLDFVRGRAFQVCVGLASLRLAALQTCEILQFACGAAIAPSVPFHQWWKIATAAKHFQR